MGAESSFDYSARLRGFDMRKLASMTVASAAALVAIAAPASAATVINLNPGPNGTLSGGFNTTITTGTVGSPLGFSEEFTFSLPSMGLTSASVTSEATIRFGATDLDFTSVTLNGQALELLAIGLNEFAFLTAGPLSTAAGTQTLVVNGLARGNGSFGGSISFSPTAAVPEPTTWALLLLGFAAIGFSMRRSKPSVRETRVRYNFA